MGASYAKPKKKITLSLSIITKNAESTLDKTLQSVQGLVDEIVCVDNLSSDKTLGILKNYSAHIYTYKGTNLSEQRKIGWKKCLGEWILVLDSDEIVSEELKDDIRYQILDARSKQKRQQVKGFYIPFQNHFLDKPLHYGGEDYTMLRLFKKNAVTIRDNLVHEGFILDYNESSVLKGRIYHYSYRSLWQVYRKFTDYAIREAHQKKLRNEKTSVWKILTYPPHMFWARFVKDKGYKDGLFRIPLDLGFAWMELVTYTAMYFINDKQ